MFHFIQQQTDSAIIVSLTNRRINRLTSKLIVACIASCVGCIGGYYLDDNNIKNIHIVL